MKKELLIISFLLLILVIPFTVKAEENVYIESIKIEENNNVEVISPATADGLKLNLDLKYKYIDSYIKYKLVVNNNTNKDYRIENNIIENDSDIIKYELTCDENNIIKAHKKKTCYANVQYENAVFFSTLKELNNSIKEDKIIEMPLTNIGISNPNTGNSYIFILLLICTSIGLIYVKNNGKTNSSLMVLIIGLVVLLPQVNALDNIKIIINSKIEIEGNTRLCSHTPNTTREFIMCELEKFAYPVFGEYIIQTSIQNGVITEKPKTIKTGLQMLSNYIKNNPDGICIEKPQLCSKYYSSLENFEDYFLNKLDWDYNSEKSITASNYKKFNDGIYFDEYRVMPFYKDSTMTDLLGYYDFRRNNPYVLDFDYPLKKETINDIQGYSFFKPDGNMTTRIRNINSNPNQNDFILFDDSPPPFFIHGTAFITFDNPIFGELEEAYNLGDLHIDINEPTNQPTRKILLSLSPETNGHIMFNARINLLQKLMDSYTIYINNKSINTSIYLYLDIVKSLKEYFEELKNIGYIEDNWEDIVNGNGSEIVKEYLRWLGNPDLKKYDTWRSKYDAVNTYEAHQAVNEEFYNYYGITIPELENHIKVIYDNKLYEGRKGIFDFFNDHYNLGVVYNSNEDEYESSIVESLLEILT